MLPISQLTASVFTCNAAPDTRMIPTPRSGLATRVVDEEVVILDRANGNVHRLNSTASAIWNLCDGKNTTDEIAAHLAEAFQLPPDQVLADVRRMVEDLEKLDLLDSNQTD